MVYVLTAMVISLVVSAGVVLYVAFPHRDQRLPVAPWLGVLLRKAAGSAPVITEDERELQRQR